MSKIIGKKRVPKKIVENRKYTAVYTTRVDRYGSCIVQVIRFEVKPGQKIMNAVNEAGYERQKKVGSDLYDICDSVTHIFDGHPNQEGEVFE